MISKLHYITQDVPGLTHAELAAFACEGGVDWVQLRVKNRTNEEWLKIARETQLVCKRYNVKLIINDNVAIAKEIGADGVHLGQHDMPPSEARKILGSGFIIGGSTNKIEDVRWIMESSVDYVGIGPFRFTNTKEKLNPVLGVEGIKNIADQCRSEKINIPMIAIGGIKAEDVKQLMEAGVFGVAVSSAINLSNERTDAANRFATLLGIKSLTNKIRYDETIKDR